MLDIWSIVHQICDNFAVARLKRNHEERYIKYISWTRKKFYYSCIRRPMPKMKQHWVKKRIFLHGWWNMQPWLNFLVFGTLNHFDSEHFCTWRSHWCKRLNQFIVWTHPKIVYKSVGHYTHLQGLVYIQNVSVILFQLFILQSVFL